MTSACMEDWSLSEQAMLDIRWYADWQEIRTEDDFDWLYLKHMTDDNREDRRGFPKIEKYEE